jgi:hypothetical protein
MEVGGRSGMVARVMERRLLQIALAAAGLVPVAGGMAGVLWGPGGLGGGEQAPGPIDSHYRFLSGLLAAIGVAYWSAIPEIEREGAKIGLLTAIVVAGGFARALGMLIAGPPGALMSAALIMELIVAPAIYVWQARVARLGAAPPAAVSSVDAGLGQG